MKYEYKPGSGLGPRSDGRTKPIQLKQHKGTTDLACQPTIGEVHNSDPRKNVFVPKHVRSPDQSSTQEEEIIDEIEGLFVEMIEKCCGKADTDH